MADFTLQKVPKGLVGDTTPPTIGTSTLSTSSVTASGWNVNFTKASDNESAQSALRYYLYISDTSNLDTVSNAETNGTLQNSGGTLDVSTLSVSGLSGSTTKWFNVVVEDEANNKSVYTQNSETSASASTDSRAGDEQALQDLYNDLGGDSWTDNTGWSSSVTLDDINTNGAYGVTVETVDSELRVTSLDLYSNGLAGTLPSSITNLSKCEYLNIKQNSITGSLPSNMPNLQSIVSLYLSGQPTKELDPSTTINYHPGKDDDSTNTFSGEIPSNFFDLPTLEYMDFSGSDCTASSLDWSSLGNVKKFYFNWHQSLILQLPSSINSMSSCEIFSITRTGFTGPWPTISGLSSVYKLSVTLDAPKGDFPDLSALGATLGEINIGGGYTGDFPNYMFDGTMTEMVNYFMTGMKFNADSFNLTNADINILPNTFTVNLSLSDIGHRLTGPFAWEIFFQGGYENFDIGWNEFDGEIDDKVYNPQWQFRGVRIASNNFQGKIMQLDWHNSTETVLNTGTVDSATANTLTDNSADFSGVGSGFGVDSVFISDGKGYGQLRSVGSISGDGHTITLSSRTGDWDVIPDGASYIVYENSPFHTMRVNGCRLDNNKFVQEDFIYKSDFNVHIQGTVDITTESTTVNGSGTTFTSDLSVGDEIKVGAESRIVDSIASDNSLEVASAFSNAHSGAFIEQNRTLLEWYDKWTGGGIGRDLTGTVSVTNGSNVVEGIGTLFTTERAVGDLVQVGSDIRTIDSITNDTELITTTNFTFTDTGREITVPTSFEYDTSKAFGTTTDQSVSTGVTVTFDDFQSRLSHPKNKYQWQYKPSGGSFSNISDGATGNGSTYSGTNTVTLEISSVASGDAGDYRLVVSNDLHDDIITRLSAPNNMQTRNSEEINLIVS